MANHSFQPISPLARFLPTVSLTSPVPLHQSSQSFPTKPQLRRLETVLTECSEVQQSLSPIWKSACLSISGSLQLLETSRQALKHPPERLARWKTNSQYEARKLEYAKRGSRPKLTSLFTGSSNADRYWHQSEEAELLSEIRRYRRAEVDLGDTFKPVKTPAVSKRNLLSKSSNFQGMNDLNSFILKERSRFQSKHKGDMRISDMEESAMVVKKPEIHRKKLKQPIKPEIRKSEGPSQSIDHWEIRRISEITGRLITDFQANGGYDPNTKVIEEYYKRQRGKPPE